uniref:Uncharacterized protein n=1 Tax=Anguilla anguilla TaxID=7936 RepID=A0A0E9SI16_ANGAN
MLIPHSSAALRFSCIMLFKISPLQKIALASFKGRHEEESSM